MARLTSVSSDSDSDIKMHVAASEIGTKPRFRRSLRLCGLPLSRRSISKAYLRPTNSFGTTATNIPETGSVCFLAVSSSEEGIAALKSPAKLRRIQGCASQDPTGLFLDLYKKTGALILDYNGVVPYLFAIVAAYAPEVVRTMLGDNNPLPQLPAPPAPPQRPRDIQEILGRFTSFQLAFFLTKMLGNLADLGISSLAATLDAVLFTRATKRQAIITVVNTTRNENFLVTDSSCYKGAQISTFQAVGPTIPLANTESYWVGVWSSGSSGGGAASAIQLSRQKQFPNDPDLRFVVAAASPLVGSNTTRVSVNDKTAKKLANENDSNGVQRDQGTSPDSKIACIAKVDSQSGPICYVLFEIYDTSKGPKVL